MNTSKSIRRVHRRMCAAPEVLEDRVVMSAGEGSTFAIMPGTVSNVGQVSSVNFKIDPTLFTAAQGGQTPPGHRRRSRYAGEFNLDNHDGKSQAGDRLDHRLIGPRHPSPAFEIQRESRQGE